MAHEMVCDTVGLNVSKKRETIPVLDRHEIWHGAHQRPQKLIPKVSNLGIGYDLRKLGLKFWVLKQVYLTSQNSRIAGSFG